MAFDFVGLTGSKFSVINKSIHKFNSGWKITGKDFVLMGSVLNFHLIYVIKFWGILKFSKHLLHQQSHTYSSYLELN